MIAPAAAATVSSALRLSGLAVVVFLAVMFVSADVTVAQNTTTPTGNATNATNTTTITTTTTTSVMVTTTTLSTTAGAAPSTTTTASNDTSSTSTTAVNTTSSMSAAPMTTTASSLVVVFKVEFKLAGSSYQSLLSNGQATPAFEAALKKDVSGVLGVPEELLRLYGYRIGSLFFTAEVSGPPGQASALATVARTNLAKNALNTSMWSNSNAVYTAQPGVTDSIKPESATELAISGQPTTTAAAPSNGGCGPMCIGFAVSAGVAVLLIAGVVGCLIYRHKVKLSSSSNANAPTAAQPYNGYSNEPASKGTVI